MIKGITHILKTDTGFQNIVGMNAALVKYKAYPVIAPQTELIPFSVVRIDNKELMHKGTTGRNRNAYRVTFTIRSYHNNYDEIDLLDRAVVQALVPFRGNANGVAFGFIEFVTSADNYVEAYGGLYERSSTFVASITEDELT